MSSLAPPTQTSEQAHALKKQKEVLKIKEMHEAQMRLAEAAQERQRERANKLMQELEENGGQNGRDSHAISRATLESLLKECAPGEVFEDDVKTALLQLADDFVEEVALNSNRLAKLRNADCIDVKDVALHLEREWDIVVPGSAGDDLMPYKRPLKPGTQTEREAKVRKSMARAVEAKLLADKEAKREARRLAKKSGVKMNDNSDDSSDDDPEDDSDDDDK
jgi:histone H3/H4